MIKKATFEISHGDILTIADLYVKDGGVITNSGNITVTDFNIEETGIVNNTGNITLTDLKLENKAIFWGPAPWGEMPKIYSSSLMTLIPSTFGEGTSLSALESMACQTAVIATNIGGLNDLPCILTNPNPKSLAQTMIENFKNREQIAQEQFNITTKIYNLDNWRRAWLKAIAYD